MSQDRKNLKIVAILMLLVGICSLVCIAVAGPASALLGVLLLVCGVVEAKFANKPSLEALPLYLNLLVAVVGIATAVVAQMGVLAGGTAALVMGIVGLVLGAVAFFCAKKVAAAVK